jgi:hypothetical protein
MVAARLILNLRMDATRLGGLTKFRDLPHGFHTQGHLGQVRAGVRSDIASGNCVVVVK